MRDEDYGFALRVWLGWVEQQQNHRHQISTGGRDPSIPSSGPESESSSPRACENRAHPASPKTDIRRNKRKPKSGSGIEQPPRWYGLDRGRGSGMQLVSSTRNTQCKHVKDSLSTIEHTDVCSRRSTICTSMRAMLLKHHRRSSGAAHIHSEAEKRELEVVNETRTPREW
jgi:hypothetical protein